ncbi:phosphoribosylamine--glycine ligase [Blattabacterium cuenoti]|uniref:phosphoribosylamine--glycine ligase n=1 Tax=Blattabacterium cuenoti TaxID=1653831 RepID=UPI00163CA491|nr:phosphoribosylamine--glycine ligase [Blattabacterium cuenoti]
MKILILGSGGREHAMGKKLLQDSPAIKLYFYPGNGGTNHIGINIKFDDIDNNNIIDNICSFVKINNIDLTVVGSETFLFYGIVNRFKHFGLPILGPNLYSFQLEGDRLFAKSFMNKYGIRTPKYHSFSSYIDAFNFIKTTTYPLVIKTNGIAEGKGVIIINNKIEAEQALHSIMIDKKFGKSGEKIIIEEKLIGKESSIISILNSKQIIPFLSAMDYKKIGEAETGHNTGGMGSISPNPYMTKDIWRDFQKHILAPTVEGLFAENLMFSGFIYFGLMITPSNKIYLLEYNTRMGDPETQSLLPIMNSNFLQILRDAMLKTNIRVFWKNLCSCCVVLSSKGYPNEYKTGHIIQGINLLKEPFFIAGAKQEYNKWITVGGRVLNLVGLGKSIYEARINTYNKVKQIVFKNCYFRKDIGLL